MHLRRQSLRCRRGRPLLVEPDEAMSKAVDKAGFEALIKRGGVGVGAGAGIPRRAAPYEYRALSASSNRQRSVCLQRT